jgi:hypothetical protein
MGALPLPRPDYIILSLVSNGGGGEGGSTVWFLFPVCKCLWWSSERGVLLGGPGGGGRSLPLHQPRLLDQSRPCPRDQSRPCPWDQSRPCPWDQSRPCAWDEPRPRPGPLWTGSWWGGPLMAAKWSRNKCQPSGKNENFKGYREIFKEIVQLSVSESRK